MSQKFTFKLYLETKNSVFHKIISYIDFVINYYTEPEFNSNEYRSEEFSIITVSEGLLLMEIEDNQFYVEEHTMVFVNKSIEFKLKKIFKTTICNIITFSFEDIEDMFSYPTKVKYHAIRSKHLKTIDFIKHLYSKYYELEYFQKKFLVNQLLHEIFLPSNENIIENGDHKINVNYNYIEKEIEAGINVSEACNDSNLSRSSFYRLQKTEKNNLSEKELERNVREIYNEE